jgi:hypothetical protein
MCAWVFAMVFAALLVWSPFFRQACLAAVLMLTMLVALVSAARAQTPGWHPTGEWQCKGGIVRIISSTDGRGAVNFEIKGAWFDNHYTLRRGNMFYNGTPCITIGDPMAFVMEGMQGSTTGKRPLVPCDQIRNPTEKDFERCGDLSDEVDRVNR